MRKSHIRDVTFLDFIIKGMPEHSPTKDIGYFVNKSQIMFKKQKKDDTSETEYWIKDKSQKIYIRDMEINNTENTVLFLLYHNDGNAAGISTSHLDTNEHRDEPLKEREGRPESVHVLISTVSSQKGENRYLGILEESGKLNRAQVQTYLSYLFRKIKKENPHDFEAKHPDGEIIKGKPKTYKYKNKFVLEGHPSKQFMQMLKDGNLSGISLVTKNHDRFSVADGAHVKPQKLELKLDTATGNWAQDGVNKYKEAINIGQQNKYEDAKISFVEPDGKSHTVRVNTATGNTYVDQFIKQVRLKNFKTMLNDADTKINPEIKTKMKEAYNA